MVGHRRARRTTRSRTARRRGRAGDAAAAASSCRGSRAAADAARPALDAFERHLRDDGAAGAEGEGRLGAELFAAKMVHTLRSGRADAGADQGPRAAGVRRGPGRDGPDRPRDLARMAPGETPPPDDDGEAVRAVLDAIAVQHPGRDDILDFCRAELARIEAFCRERNVIGLADEPLEIRWTPVFLRSFGGAMLDSPGPLDKGQKAFFSVTPIPTTGRRSRPSPTSARTTTGCSGCSSSTRPCPGHYLQGVYANRSPSLARSIFWSGVFAEGWAVYVTQVMMDLGFDADDPGAAAQPLEVLPAGGHQRADRRRDPHRGHDRGRGRLADGRRRLPGGGRGPGEVRPGAPDVDPACTYFVGSMQMWDLERDRRRALAAASAIRAAPRPCRSHGSSAGSARRPASTTGRTSRTSSPTARRRSRCSGGSCSRTEQSRLESRSRAQPIAWMSIVAGWPGRCTAAGRT